MRTDLTRRRCLATAVAGVTGSLAGYLGRDNGGANNEPLPAQLDERVPELLDYYDVPGASVALVEGGEATWTGAYGEADREEGRPATTATVFRVASITKSVTAWAVMTLVERGDIALDDPVERHVTRWELPEADFDTEEVTVRRLLSHTSGLRMDTSDDDELYAPGDEVPLPEEVLAGEGLESAVHFEQPPGTEFSYSNAGFVVLEVLIEEVSGRDYAAYVEDAVLGPLEMNDATFALADAESAVATGYFLNGERGPEFVDPVKAPGGLYATADDIAAFVAAASTGPDGEPPGRGVIQPESLEEVHAPAAETAGLYGLVSDAYGLGHFVEGLPGGERAVWHGGQHTGWLSHYHCVPATGDGIVVLTNSERAQRLLADVVGDWAEARGLSRVALSRTYGRIATGVKATTAVVALAGAGLAWRLGRGLQSTERRFAPLARESVGMRVALTVGALLVAGLWWAVGRTILTPLLPVLAGWLTVALSAFALLAVLLVLFPRTEDNEP